MKLRDYKEHTFKICRRWIHNPNPKNLQTLIANLTRWAKGPGEAYPFTDTYPGFCVEYCADRMNPGRAKAILIRIKNRAGDTDAI